MEKFEALAKQVRQQIKSGDLRPGDPLPAIAQLREQFKISYADAVRKSRP